MSSGPCVACADQPGGCERCRGGPGEQGFSLDEKELLDLRACQIHLNAALRRAAARLKELGDPNAADGATAASVVWGPG